MASLLDIAFRKVIGVKGATPGIKTIKSLASPSLLEIAPAVWDMQYLQAIYVRSQLIPSIAAGIGRLRNAHSATLRRKLDNLARPLTPAKNDQELAGSRSDVTDEVRQRLWLLCQTRIRAGLVRRPFATRQAERNTVEQPRVHLGLAGTRWENTPIHETDVGYLPTTEHHDLAESFGLSGGLSEVLFEPAVPEIGVLEETSDSYALEDGVPSSDNLTLSSEGDYFYTDGQGNVYPIAREAVAEDGQTEWLSTQLTDPYDFSQTQGEELEEHWLGNPGQTFIMYQGNGTTDPVGHINTNAAAEYLFPPPYPEDAPLGS
ncbi:hypothetical protein L209DRAFT_691579 [Thermothelomyces heterothallicus CBS 203.75]